MKSVIKENYKVNKDIVSYIENNLPVTDNKLQLAIAIYILTGKIFEYNASYHLYRNLDRHKFTHNITLKNNKIICSQWAKIYSMLLKYHKIDAEAVRFGKHYFVYFTINDITYKADITMYGYSNINDKYNISDISNIKFGFDINGISVSYNSKISSKKLNDLETDLNKQISFVRTLFDDKLIKRKRINELKEKLNQKIEQHKKENTIEDNIEYRIKILNYFLGFSYADGVIERYQLLKKYIPELFSDFKDIRYTSLYNVKKNIQTFMLIYIKVNNHDLYYLQTENGFINIKKENLLKELKERKLKLEYDEYISGIEYYSQNALKLKKQ